VHDMPLDPEPAVGSVQYPLLGAVPGSTLSSGPGSIRAMAASGGSVLVPLVGVLTVATTWFSLYVTVIAKWMP